jgi:hypothetical protein
MSFEILVCTYNKRTFLKGRPLVKLRHLPLITTTPWRDAALYSNDMSSVNTSKEHSIHNSLYPFTHTAYSTLQSLSHPYNPENPPSLIGRAND